MQLMKKVYFLTVCFLFCWTHVTAQNSVTSSRMEISFAFNRQSGFSSNQFAVWIEDGRGILVKTLYAPKFTATGGWEKRPESIPLWVSKSGLSALGKQDIDAFTGATPRTGAVSYRWDGTNKNGSPLPAGEYRVFLEATLRGENRVLYSASFALGSGAGNSLEAEAKAVYFGSSTKERGMIQNVKVLYRP